MRQEGLILTENFGFDYYCGPEKRCFISYKKDDAQRVGAIADAIHSYGINLWYENMDGRKAPTPDAWTQCIQENMHACSVLLAFISQDFFNDMSYMASELSMASSMKMPTIYILLDPPAALTPTDQDYYLLNQLLSSQYLDFSTGVPQDQLSALIGRIMSCFNIDTRDTSQLDAMIKYRQPGDVRVAKQSRVGSKFAVVACVLAALIIVPVVSNYLNSDHSEETVPSASDSAEAPTTTTTVPTESAAVQESAKHFDSGCTFYQNQNYEAAIEQFRMVDGASEFYVSAQTNLISAKNAYQQDEVATIQNYINAGEYDSAKIEVEHALHVLEFDTELERMQKDIDKAIAEGTASQTDAENETELDD